ncbi:MAG: Holliday junction branch migration protein RuvA [Bacteroidia bacterium]|nr:Holliday junction branch migration protein RuvA [Bacteroidia bacterium]
MFDFVEGKIAEKNPAFAVIDCHGVGYYLPISLNTFSRIPESGTFKLFTHFVVREDAQLLYGFADREERQLFRLLISVNGVGSATALMILSALPPAELIGIIASGNDVALRAIKGVGPKTAQRIIIELKDKVGKTGIAAELFPLSQNKSREEALSALVTLGFNKQNVEKFLDKQWKENPNALVEDLIRLGLKSL